MTRLDVYFYEDVAKTTLAAKFSSTTDHPLAAELHMNPCPRHVDLFQIDAAAGLPFYCEVIGILNDPKFPAHLGLSIGIDELPRWRAQCQALHFEPIAA